MTKNKHDHKASKKLKSLIFGIMLLLPFLFLLPTGIYYALNQTATQSETTIIETNYYNTDYELPSISNPVLQEGNLYCANIRFTLPNDLSEYIWALDYVYPNAYDYDDRTPYETVDNEYQVVFDGDIYIDVSDVEYCYYGYTQTQITFAINSNGYDLNCIKFLEFFPITLQIPSGTNTTTTNTNSVSTSVINAWNDTWSNPLFSWADSSPFNNAINGFTNVFNIQVENHINTMLAYEFSIIAIYVVFDIVIELFICLTHIIPRSD